MRTQSERKILAEMISGKRTIFALGSKRTLCFEPLQLQISSFTDNLVWMTTLFYDAHLIGIGNRKELAGVHVASYENSKAQPV